MKYINYILIVLGAIVALYAKAGEEQSLVVLITGIVLFMIGIYRISKTIPSKHNDEQDQIN